jgi:taurine dehydrogenase small subunit
MRRSAVLALVALALAGAALDEIGPVTSDAGSSLAAAQSGERDLEKLLEAFADAWNRHDVDALMSMMTDDGVFEASAGNEVNGQRHEGPRAVRASYEAVFALYPDAHWGNARHFVKGTRGVSEWTFTGTLKDGRRVEVTGCDLFTFRNGKIAVKNSFRKNRPPVG